MQHISWRQAILCCLVCAGCTSNQYEIQITPRGKEYERTLHVAQARGQDRQNLTSLGEPELQRIAEAYRQPVPVPVEQWHLFSARFDSQTPQDVGGFGTYAHYASPFGEFMGYVERFRGSDDAVSELEARYQAVDVVVDFLVGWFQAEVGDQPDFETLRKFLNESLRHDLKNLSFYTYAWNFDHVPSQQSGHALLMRLLQYLSEREYLQHEEIPDWVRAARQKNRLQLGERVQRMLARKLGVADGEPLPETLRALSDLTIVEESLRKYLESTREYQEQLAARRADDPQAEWDPLSLLGNALFRALSPRGIFRGHDRVSLSIATGQRPISSNGDWDEKTRAIGWTLEIEAANVSGGHELPNICYALWSVPHEAYQIAHFGSVLLDGEMLGTFNIWYQGLTPDERTEWDEFIETLHPSNELGEQLQAFRFQTVGSEVTAEDRDTLADPAVSLIVQQLESLRSVRTFQPVP